jgi:hypothetical protein
MSKHLVRLFVLVFTAMAVIAAAVLNKAEYLPMLGAIFIIQLYGITRYGVRK